MLIAIAMCGVYLVVAWASYSPLDNGWSVASSVTERVLNKAGGLGAWLIDLLFSMFGHLAFFVPFVFVFVPTYLVFQGYEKLTWRQAFFWVLSFVILMIGLSGLASVLFSNSVAYLAGGFVGAILANLAGGILGVFGTLFCSMILTTIGFYFCSGQIILQLFNRLYDWILEEKIPLKSVSEELDITQQAVSPIEKNVVETDECKTTELQADKRNTNPIKLEQKQSNTEQPIEAQLTDVSVFTRPNITGLKAEPASVPPSSHKASTMFMVENDTVLPNVRVPEFTRQTKIPPVFENKQSADITSEPMLENNELAFPTIRLKPSVAQPEQVIANEDNKMMIHKKEENLLKSKEVIREVGRERSSKTRAIEVENIAELEGTKELEQDPFIEMPKVSVINSPNFLKSTNEIAIPEPVKEEEAEQAVSSPAKTAYPKGYGESLIHPLLDRKKQIEKPTTPLPTLDLLSESTHEPQQITENEIIETSARIEQELANFGVKATVEDVLVGPVVTRYEIKPAAGVKASKITNLDSDLARALIFKAIRITDVVPGKPFMGIETPNRHRQTVWLRDVLDSPEFHHSKAILPMALGKDISGNPVVVDMAKMPHLLVAGQTGGGKSVGVNSMILSLLFKLSPEQVRFIMIDPKVVELSIYNDIPHLLTPVVTDTKKAENALRWAVEEMERRYLLVSSLGVRSIEGYNHKIDQAAEMDLPIPNPLWRPGDTMDSLPPPLKKMSYIVLIVDEFADLMMSVGKQVEDHIMRIAQKARAVGIHLILATQRPSADVITGVIKANIPSRIAFTVASQIDSRTILDKGGAESLLGRGDMLYSGAGSPEIIRIHGAFMTDDDVQRVADNWRARGKPEYIESITESSEEGESSERTVGNDVDPLFDEITQYVIDSNVTSISGIQRRFSIGFNRAARIIDQMEEQRIISSPDNRGKREVLAR
ncbi:cell division protein FtsK [Vespertiliibacter pulmonis]|nr:DNA translocase FtsK [Vespertiliibacter pulmonis]QLB21604.1 cell division protein FtsK [Vespertiliibacter pulmonis]